MFNIVEPLQQEKRKVLNFSNNPILVCDWILTVLTVILRTIFFPSLTFSPVLTSPAATKMSATSSMRSPMERRTSALRWPLAMLQLSSRRAKVPLRRSRKLETGGHNQLSGSPGHLVTVEMILAALLSSPDPKVPKLI